MLFEEDPETSCSRSSYRSWHKHETDSRSELVSSRSAGRFLWMSFLLRHAWSLGVSCSCRGTPLIPAGHIANPSSLCTPFIPRVICPRSGLGHILLGNVVPHPRSARDSSFVEGGQNISQFVLLFWDYPQSELAGSRSAGSFLQSSFSIMLDQPIWGGTPTLRRFIFFGYSPPISCPEILLWGWLSAKGTRERVMSSEVQAWWPDRRRYDDLKDVGTMT